MADKIETFKDLVAWKTAHSLTLLVYKATQKFPKEELFGLTNQLRRSVVSVESNIAEGFGRFSFKEKAQFYYIAAGSLLETECQIIIARDLNYINEDQFLLLDNKIISTSKLLHGLIKKSKEYS